jgi:hypothetical protein
MRGRPKNIENLPINILPKRQFTREYKNSDGSLDIWTYNLDKFSNWVMPSLSQVIFIIKYNYD